MAERVGEYQSNVAEMMDCQPFGVCGVEGKKRKAEKAETEEEANLLPRATSDPKASRFMLRLSFIMLEDPLGAFGSTLKSSPVLGKHKEQP
jgi:hypothetical protein